MNIFVLCSGRCGSMAFTKACSHITNFTSAHESRLGMVGHDRMKYPSNHIEVDNRLSWMLGELSDWYDCQPARYVWLRRNVVECGKSFEKRRGIFEAYQKQISCSLRASGEDLVHTINANIGLFLRKQPHKYMVFHIEQAERYWPEFCKFAGAEGDLDKGLEEFNKGWNASR